MQGSCTIWESIMWSEAKEYIEVAIRFKAIRKFHIHSTALTLIESDKERNSLDNLGHRKLFSPHNMEGD